MYVTIHIQVDHSNNDLFVVSAGDPRTSMWLRQSFQKLGSLGKTAYQTSIYLLWIVVLQWSQSGYCLYGCLEQLVQLARIVSSCGSNVKAFGTSNVTKKEGTDGYRITYYMGVKLDLNLRLQEDSKKK
jgi:hypothetical protein